MGGGCRVVSVYAQELKRRGHQVHLVAVSPRPIPFLQTVKMLLRGKGWSTRELRRRSHFDNTGLDLTVLKKSGPVTDADVPDADVVIATWWETAEWLAQLDRRKGAKIYFVQGHEVFPHLPRRSRETYKLPLHKIVVARWLKNIMERQYGDFHVDIVPNSVDHDLFFALPRGKQERPTVGFMYASAHFKGVDITLDAIAKLKAGFPNLRIVSFGNEHPNTTLELPAGTEFHHSPPQEHIREIYTTCDVWITASRSEGFNLPAMEAMACRTPVVSTRTGWPQEAIKSNWNGMLVDVEDTAGLVDCVASVLSRSDSEWREMSANAFATVASSTWDQSASAFESALLRAYEREEGKVSR